MTQNGDNHGNSHSRVPGLNGDKLSRGTWAAHIRCAAFSLSEYKSYPQISIYLLFCDREIRGIKNKRLSGICTPGQAGPTLPDVTVTWAWLWITHSTAGLTRAATSLFKIKVERYIYIRTRNNLCNYLYSSKFLFFSSFSGASPGQLLTHHPQGSHPERGESEQTPDHIQTT